MRILNMLQRSLIYKAALIDVVIYVFLCVINEVNSDAFESKCEYGSCQNVLCSGIDGENRIADCINLEVQKECDCITLDISNSAFENDTLRQNWLSTLKPTINVRELTLKDCKLNKIEAGAFSNRPFTYMRILFIINSGLKMIKQDIFEGVSGLTSFSFISFMNSYELMVEDEVFDKVGLSLAIVEINRFKISEKTLISLFGAKGALLPSLKLLHLGYNNIKKIPEYAFMNAFQLESITLESTGIEEVDEKAFWNNSVVTKLNLANNSIETLGPLTFKNLQSLKPSNLYLNGNYWSCTCSLQWLKDMYLTNNTINKDIPLECSNDLSFEDSDFCSTTEVTTDSQTTTNVAPVYTTLECRIMNSSSSYVPTAGRIHIVELLIKNEVVTLEFQELESETLQVNIIVSNIATDDLRNYFLLWFNSINMSDYGCITPLYNTQLLTDLNWATTYSFSLVKENDTEISPKASFGFTTSPEWSQRVWISNSKKTLVLSLTTCFMIVIGCLTAIITFFCLRPHREEPVNSNDLNGLPKDSYGYVDNASTKEYEKPAYWEPYVITSTQGYLTPKHNKYDKVRYKPSLSRSVSEWSMYTTSAIYDEYSCKGPDIWSTSQYKKRANFKQNRINRYDEFKPPLPPPNEQIYN
ncbi:hypothetical protein RN001_011806 [Aquatica leii]|uniref:Uncharacterized protein n=1 Tax=Aquatica leii TaxID=1421715 RepID=A0AAN7SET8_9COLE|nr:hypothetical protein RN001_011806 [Aquatica leii]